MFSSSNTDEVSVESTSCSVLHNECKLANVCSTDASNNSSAENDVLMGVKLIWVAKEYRRKRVAHKLLDTARKSFLFGKLICLENVVFSQPTQDGFEFATKYCQSESIWVYV